MNRCILTYGLCIALAIFAFGCKTAPEFTGRVTVLTYDANHPDTLTPEIERAIGEADADVVCIQEARSGWCQSFKHQFRNRYPVSMFVSTWPLDWGDRPAFFSKYPLREIQFVPPVEKGWSNVWLVEAQTPAGPVQIANVCLSGQEQEMDAILKAMKPATPSLIVGNFSDKRHEPSVLRAQHSEFTDVLPKFDERSPTGPSWRLVFPMQAQRDHILCSSHFRPDAARVLASRESYHRPVWAELSLVKMPTTAPVAARE